MNGSKLTPAQSAVLEHAVLHTSGNIEWFPDHIKGAARKKVLDALAKQGLVEMVGEQWQLSEFGHNVLEICKPEAEAEPAADVESAGVAEAASSVQDAELEAVVAAAEASWNAQASAAPLPRRSTKQAEVIKMMRRPEGATISQICEATGWLPHTVRGAFAGIFKRRLGLTIVSEKPEEGERVYRLA